MARQDPVLLTEADSVLESIAAVQLPIAVLQSTAPPPYGPPSGLRDVSTAVRSAVTDCSIEGLRQRTGHE